MARSTERSRVQGSRSRSQKPDTERSAWINEIDRMLEARERARQFFETLEQRMLLTGTHDAALAAAIQSALATGNSSGFSAWSHKLTGATVLGKQLPIIGGGLGAGYDPQAQLNGLLSRLSGSYTTLAQLQTALEGSAGIGDGVAVTATHDNADDISLDLHFNNTQNVTIPVAANYGGVNFDLGGSLNVATTLDFTFTLGAYWDSVASAPVVYIPTAGNQLNVTAAVNTATLNANAHLGFIGIAASAGAVTLSPSFAMTLADPGPAGGPGRITFTELNATPLPTLVTLNLTAPPATLSASITSSLIPAAKTLTFTWSDINAPTTTTSNLTSDATLANYKGLSQLTGAQLSAGINSFTTWTGNIGKSPNLLGIKIPIVGTGLGAVVNLPSTLHNRLIDQVGTFTDVDQVRTKYAAESDLNNVTTSLVGNNLQFSVGVHPTFSTNIPLQLEIPGLDLQLDTPGVASTMSLTGTLNFGVDLSTGNFYVNDSTGGTTLSVSATVNSPNFNSGGEVGFATLNVTGGAATANANATLTFTAPTAGHLTSTDFAGGLGTVNNLSSMQFAGSGALSLPISSTLLGIPTQTLTATFPDFKSPASTISNASSFAQYENYTTILPVQFSQALDRVVTLLSQEANASAAFNANIPLLNQSASNLVNIATQLHNVLTQYTDAVPDVNNVLTTPFHDAASLLTLLQNLPGVGVGNVTALGTANDIRFTLHKTDTINRSVPINLGIGTQVALDLTGTINATLATTTNITFGVDKTGSFFIVDPGATPVFQANVSVNANLNANVNLGFLGVNVTGGSATMAGAFTLTLHDPATDSPATPGIITEKELSAADVTTLATATVNGSAALALPLSTTFFPETATLQANWADITNANTFTVNTAQFQKFFNFSNLTAAGALQGLQQIPAILNHLIDSTAFGKNLQFFGSSLSSAIGIGNQFLTQLNNMGAFTSVQALQTALNNQLGGAANVIVNVGASDLEFTLSLNQNLIGKTIQFSINKTIPGTSLGFQTSGNLTLTGNVRASVQFGIAFGSVATVTDRFYIIQGANSQASVNFGVNGSLNGAASIGFASVNVSGTATVSGMAGGTTLASITLPLVDNYNHDGKITVTELLSNPVTALGTPVFDGAAQVVFQVTGLPGTGPNPQLTLNWADLSSSAVPTINPNADLIAGINAAIGFNAQTILAGIQTVLNLINSWAGSSLLNTKIPLIQKTVNQLFDFVGKTSSFFTSIKNANVSTPPLFDAAVNAAVSALPGGVITLTAKPDNAPSSGIFHYLMNINYNAFAGASQAFDFGSSLFALNAMLSPMFTFHAGIEFGVNKTDGFYIVDQGNLAGPEVTINAGIGATIDKLGGTFGPVTYGVSQGTASVNFGLGIDLVDPNPNNGGKIGVSDIAGNLGTVFQPTIAGTGLLHLPIGFRIGGAGGPGVSTIFDANWNSNDAANIHFGATGNSTDPASGFGQVNYELGDFVNGIIGPVLQNIKQYNPLPKDLIDFMNKKLPVFNQTPAEVLGNAFDHKEVALLFKIAGVISDLTAVSGSGSTLNLSSYFAAGEQNTGTAGSTGGGNTGPFSTLVNDLAIYHVSAPILSDTASTIIGLLLKKDVTLIEFNPGKLDLPFTFPGLELNIPLWSVGVVDVEGTFRLSGGIDFYANVDIGLTTRGLFGNTIDGTSNLMNGFFIGDTKPGAPNGPDAFEVGLRGSLRIDLGGTVRVLGINAATITGYIQGNLDLGLDLADVAYKPGTNIPDHRVGRQDTGGDNKVYFDEMQWIASHYGPLCVATIGGSLSITGGIHIEALCGFWGCLYSQDFPLGTQVLVNWDLPCPPLPQVPLAQIVGNKLVMFNDASTGGKEININITRDDNNQPYAIQIQKKDDSGTQTDLYTFAQLSAAGVDTLVVNGTEGPDKINIDSNLTKLYNLKYLVVNGFAGNDRIDTGLIDSASSHLLGTTLNGGDGNDTIIGTFAPDNISGGAGDDVIVGGGGNDTIDGGDGNDKISVQSGNSVITGGIGNDTINAGDGNNNIDGGDGNDIIGVGNGSNTIGGGNGDDVIIAGDGGNTVDGGAGNDTIQTGAGNDSITGGSGNDSISSGAGNDYVDAGSGDDYVDAGSGNDTVFGGTGNDNLFGGDGNDVIHAGDGTDYVDAGIGNDLVYGDTGNKKIYGQSGNDTIYGGTGNNFIDAGSGNDYIVGSVGSNTIYGGTGDDYINANGTISGTIDGGDGSDLLVQKVDQNQTLTDTTLATISGSIALANLERIQLNGGAGNNQFDVSGWNGLAGTAPVTLTGGGGTDTVVSTNDTDFVLTDTSLARATGVTFVLNGVTQAILTGGVSDNSFDVTGFNGNATLTGSGGNDRVVDSGDTNFVLTNTSLVRASGGSFTLAGINRALLTGGASANTIDASGFSGNTTLLGQAGNDSIYGGSGDDSIDGGLGNDSLVANAGNDVIIGGGAAGGGDIIQGGGWYRSAHWLR